MRYQVDEINNNPNYNSYPYKLHRIEPWGEEVHKGTYLVVP